MALEIERKFLTRVVPNVKYDQTLMITQYYCTKPRVRIREVWDTNNLKSKYYLTTKKRLEAGIYDEQEREINLKEFNKLKKTANKVISKTRYVKKFGQLKAEIDEFHDIMLVITEVELPKKNYKLILPKWLSSVCIAEVTQIEELTNKNLATTIKK